MAEHYLTPALLASARRRAMLPDGTAETLADDDLIEFANDELASYIVPLILSTREEFFVVHRDVAVVSGTASYPIPERAIGMKLRSVQLSDGSGGFRDLPRLEPERVDEYATSGQPAAYYLRGNSVVLVPLPSGTATLRLGYFRRPSRLVLPEACNVVLYAVQSKSTIELTQDTIFSEGDLLDVVSHAPGFDALYDDVTQESTAMGDGGPNSVIDVSENVTVAPGDFVCAAGTAPIAQIPPDLHPLLAQRIAVRALEALGHTQKQQAAETTAARLERSAVGVLSQRVEGSSRIVVNRHGPGYGRLRRAGPRWR